MNEDYLRLGRLIAGQCTPGFREARLEAELDGGGRADMRISCTLPDGREIDEELRGAAITEIHLSLESIRDRMKAESGEGWRSCTVTLIAGGGFRMDVR